MMMHARNASLEAVCCQHRVGCGSGVWRKWLAIRGTLDSESTYGHAVSTRLAAKQKAASLRSAGRAGEKRTPIGTGDVGTISKRTPLFIPEQWEAGQRDTVLATGDVHVMLRPSSFPQAKQSHSPPAFETNAHRDPNGSLGTPKFCCVSCSVV